MTIILDYSALGIATGGLYALIALGIIVIFRASHTFNFAMGEMMTLSAYFFYTIAVTYSFGIVAGLIASAIGSVIVALLIERAVLRPMVGQPFIAIVMVTFGVGSVLRGVMSLIWGPMDRQVPALLARDPVMLGEIFIPGKSARAFAIAVILLLLNDPEVVPETNSRVTNLGGLVLFAVAAVLAGGVPTGQVAVEERTQSHAHLLAVVVPDLGEDPDVRIDRGQHAS